MKNKGVEAPSAITEALVDVSDDDAPIGDGFFGKYLKKHIDLKKKAQAEVEEANAAEARRKQEVKEKMKR
jgi:uncharacterized protein (UPF0335 family)